MTSSPVRIREVELNSDDYRHELALRAKVLREPLGLRLSPEDLELDPSNIHLGLFENGVLQGCLLLLPQDSRTMKMRQVAIEPLCQGRGFGRLLVEHSETLAYERGYQQMILHARETAVSFYSALGYETEGSSFTEVGIPHRKMRKDLTRIFS